MVVVNRMRWGQTVIPNAFIDRYLASANGEYVKVYLLLLRLMDESSLSVAAMADRLELTEKDVERALRYWEKAGLLKLVFSDSQLQQMTILELPEEKNEPIAQEGVSIVFGVSGGKAAAGKGKSPEPGGTSEPARSPQTDEAPEAELSPAQGEEFRQLVYVSEQYLGRTLTRKDLELFNRMYTEMGFSAELIEYLVEYCVDNGRKTVNYMEAVAEGWRADEITTVRQAKDQTQNFRESKKNGTNRKAKAGSRFQNFTQRATDYNAILQEELSGNGTDQ